jgi:hypothetical protein
MAKRSTKRMADWTACSTGGRVGGRLADGLEVGLADGQGSGRPISGQPWSSLALGIGSRSRVYPEGRNKKIPHQSFLLKN